MSNKVYLGVKNYGPLHAGTSGLKDGLLSVPKYFLIIGDQGSGKSTVAKLLSTLSWLEKALIRRYFDAKSFLLKNLLTLLRNQNLPESYMTNATKIEYVGQVYRISVSNGKLTIKDTEKSDYVCPQIMYFPSERNMLSAIQNPWDKRGLPDMVSQLATEFLNASLKAGSRKRQLFSDYKISFDPRSRQNFIIDGSGKSVIPINNASSGLQSLTPLLVVSEYLAKGLKEDFLDRLKNESVNLREVFLDSVADEALSMKLANFFISGLKNSFTDDDIVLLQKRIGKYVNSCLWEIVEEPEQNLFPSSQVTLLRKLIEYISSEGRLIITTHSPYLLSAMNIFMFAKDKYDIYGKTVREIPQRFMIDFDTVMAYKIENGSVRGIMDYESRMIDASEIDNCSSEINRVFDKLFAIGG